MRSPGSARVDQAADRMASEKTTMLPPDSRVRSRSKNAAARRPSILRIGHEAVTVTENGKGAAGGACLSTEKPSLGGLGVRAPFERGGEPRFELVQRMHDLGASFNLQGAIAPIVRTDGTPYDGRHDGPAPARGPRGCRRPRLVLGAARPSTRCSPTSRPTSPTWSASSVTSSIGRKAASRRRGSSSARARRIQRELDALTADAASMGQEVAGGRRAPSVIGTTARWLVPQPLRASRAPKVQASSSKPAPRR